MSKLTLRINKAVYQGFENVDIFKSMNAMSGSFLVSINNQYKNNIPYLDIKIGDAVKVEINDQTVIDGWIDRLPIRYGKNYNWMDIIGRDKTCDLIDCSFDFIPNEWKKQSIENIIKNLCSPFGISITVDSSVSSLVSTKIETFKANEGVMVSDTIAELCRDYAILPICYNDGKITLTKASTNKYTKDSIISGYNIDAAYSDQNNENRYSVYKVKGQGISTDNKGLTDYISCYGNFNDNIISRTRPLTIFSELPTTTGGCQKRAKWEARVRAGMSRSVEYLIPKWDQSDGKFWPINQLVKVSDDILGYNNTTMLILSTRFIYNETEGEATKLNLVPKDTFEISDNPITIKTEFDR